MNKKLFLIAFMLVSFRLAGSQSVCYSSKCLEISSVISKDVDLKIDPCDDFYSFVCNKFKEKYVLTKAERDVSSYTITEKQKNEKIFSVVSKSIKKSDPKYIVLLKSIFQGCMNSDEIEKRSLRVITKIFEKSGGWPLLRGNKWDKDKFRWANAIYKFKRLGLHADMFFKISVARDYTNSSKVVLQLSQPEQNFAKQMTKEDRKNYRNYLIKTAEAFGAKRDRARTAVKKVIELDAAISKILVPPEKIEINRKNNMMKIRELQNEFPYLPSWLQFINSLLSPYKTMKHDDIVIVTAPHYFKKLKSVFKKNSKRTIANFMYWKIILSITPYMNNSTRDILLPILKVGYGMREYPERWMECIENVKALPVATSALYVKYYSFDKGAKVAATEIEEYVKYAMNKTLQAADWMDDATKHYALEKLNKMGVYVGYPKELHSRTIVDSFYENLFVDPLKYLQSMLNVTIFNDKISLQSLTEPVNKKDWRFYASFVTSIKPVYIHSSNTIVIPVGVLQTTFFDKSRPESMNFGTLGVLIGHQMTHGFDETGRKFDKNGNLMNWWLSNTEANFKAKAQCIINQYDRFSVFSVNKPKKKINGMRTQLENIADNAGIKQAYLAYKKWIKDNGAELYVAGLPYTPEQLFWISTGKIFCRKTTPRVVSMEILTDIRSPSKLRLNLPLRNSEYFVNDFNCPVGSAMNPRKKCAVW